MKKPWQYQMKPFRMFGNLYFVGTRAAGSHLIETDDGLVLLDTGYPQTFYLIMQNMHDLGFSPYDVKHIIHSHGHYDHVGGTAALAAMSGAKTYIGAKDAEMVRGNEKTDWAYELGMRDGGIPYRFDQAFEPDVLLSDGDVLQFGNVSVTCLSTPGHTAGTMSYFLDVTDGARTLRAGMFGGSGTNSMYKTYLDQYHLSHAYREAYPQVIERMRSMHVDIMMGNHNGDNNTLGRYERMQAEGGNPFIDATAWPQFLDNAMMRYQAMLDQNE